MQSMILLSLVAAVLASPVSLEGLDSNSTGSDAVPVFSLNIGSIFPFFGPVDFDAKRDKEPLDDAIDPMEPPSNDTDPSGGVVSIHIMEVFSFQDPNAEDNSLIPEQSQPSLLRQMFEKIMADIGLLDLSGRDLTSQEVYEALKARKEKERPVTTLLLSNSRVHPSALFPLTEMFTPAEDTISTLVLANTSINLDALQTFTNLKVLNLTNNSLTTFPWYPGMADTLEVLDLSNNNFEEVRPELSMLKSLRELYLSNNKIRYVEEAPLNLLPNLDTLDLSMNVLEKANFAGLNKLNRLNVDWNYLRLMGNDCRLPSQPLTLKLASNPWRCDCSLLHSRDSNEILDIDQLQCANHQSYTLCDNCPRQFLPTYTSPDSQFVSDLTKDSIQHLDCFDFPELYHAISRLRQEEPDKFIMDVCLFTGLFIILIGSATLIFIKCCRKKNTNRKFWLKVQQIPHLDMIGKPQEVPYIKIDESGIKA